MRQGDRVTHLMPMTSRGDRQCPALRKAGRECIRGVSAGFLPKALAGADRWIARKPLRRHLDHADEGLRGGKRRPPLIKANVGCRPGAHDARMRLHGGAGYPPQTGAEIERCWNVRSSCGGRRIPLAGGNYAKRMMHAPTLRGEWGGPKTQLFITLARPAPTGQWPRARATTTQLGGYGRHDGDHFQTTFRQHSAGEGCSGAPPISAGSRGIAISSMARC